MADPSEKYEAEITPEMLQAGWHAISCAIPEHEMWDEDSLVKDCWAAMRAAQEETSLAGKS